MLDSLSFCVSITWPRIKFTIWVALLWIWPLQWLSQQLGYVGYQAVFPPENLGSSKFLIYSVSTECLKSGGMKLDLNSHFSLQTAYFHREPRRPLGACCLPTLRPLADIERDTCKQIKSSKTNVFLKWAYAIKIDVTVFIRVTFWNCKYMQVNLICILHWFATNGSYACVNRQWRIHL